MLFVISGDMLQDSIVKPHTSPNPGGLLSVTFGNPTGSPDFVVINKPHILTRPGITESRTVVLDTVYTINPGEPSHRGGSQTLRL